MDHGQDIVKSHPLLQPIRLQEIKKYQQACTNKNIKEKAEEYGRFGFPSTQKLVISSEQARILHAAFGGLRLSLFRATKNNATNNQSTRRYDDQVKEFVLTLYFYSLKAYKYVRTIISQPNPSLLRKWSSSVDCQPGFSKEAFTASASEVRTNAIKKDCCLTIDAIVIRKQCWFCGLW